MIIIVEGIDRVGKTTLCNKLSAELNMPIYKHSQSVIDYSVMDNLNETDKMLHLLDICKLSNANIIFDRFHFSDYVYGIIERQYDENTATNNLHILDDLLTQMDAIVILMYPTDIVSSSLQHGKDLDPYFELMKKARAISKTFVYTCDYKHIDKMVEEVRNVSNEKNRI